jgi:hypothetical protein
MLLRDLFRCTTHGRHYLAYRFDLCLELCASTSFFGRIRGQPLAFKRCLFQLCTLLSQLGFQLNAIGLRLRPLLLDQLLAVLSARLLCACRSGLVLRREPTRFLKFSCQPAPAFTSHR